MKCHLATLVLLVVIPLAPGVAVAGEPEVLARVERRTATDLGTLRTAGIPIVMETNGGLFLRGSAAEVERARALGYATDVLDRPVGEADYYTVGLRPDSDRAALARLGATLWTEENWVLLSVPADAAAEAVLQGARVFFRRLSRTPIAAPRDAPAAVPTPVPAADATPLAADPIVQKIVNAVSPAQIDQFWPTLIANPPTRYALYHLRRGAATRRRTASTRAAAQARGRQYQDWSPSNAPERHRRRTRARPARARSTSSIGHLDDLPSYGTAPGADDNASGSVAVLESAKALSCWAFRNTVKFLHVTGEEPGLYGSEAYAARRCGRAARTSWASST